MSETFVTTNMYFLCEANINIEKGTVKNISSKKTEVSIEDGILTIKKDGRTLKGNIKDFKGYGILAEDFATIDFWSESFLKEILKKNLLTSAKIENAISGNGCKGYVLEATISFKENSSFFTKWNEERKKKGEIFMESLSNI